MVGDQLRGDGDSLSVQLALNGTPGPLHDNLLLMCAPVIPLLPPIDILLPIRFTITPAGTVLSL